MNTMETYRKINQWSSHSRDMVESFKRYYNNSFLDGQRQEAYNLFLGNYIFAQGQPMLWDLSTDYYLHHADPRSLLKRNRRNYIQWFTPANLEQTGMPVVPFGAYPRAGKAVHYHDDYWLEYYRPLAVSSFWKIFSYRMNSSIRYAPIKSTPDGSYDLSPFRIRDGHDQETSERYRPKKGVKILDPSDEPDFDNGTDGKAYSEVAQNRTATNWLKTQRIQPGILKDARIDAVDKEEISHASQRPKDKTAMNQWTLNQFIANSLDPSVATSEMEEYGRYISHPLNLPLVVSTETPPAPSMEFLSYVQSGSKGASADMYATEEDIADYASFLHVGENPLTVTDADLPKKRYKAYRQWLKGKSLFKQSRVDL